MYYNNIFQMYIKNNYFVYFIGIIELYTSNHGAYDTVHMIMELSLIPGNKINEGFISIQIFYEENINLKLSTESQENLKHFSNIIERHGFQVSKICFVFHNYYVNFYLVIKSN